MARLRVERVSSASRLSGALLPGQAEDFGSFDGEILEVEDSDLVEELSDYYNVEVVSEGRTPRVEAGKPTYNCGVNGCSRTVDSEEETCWQHPKGDE